MQLSPVSQILSQNLFDFHTFLSFVLVYVINAVIQGPCDWCFQPSPRGEFLSIPAEEPGHEVRLHPHYRPPFMKYMAICHDAFSALNSSLYLASLQTLEQNSSLNF